MALYNCICILETFYFYFTGSGLRLTSRLKRIILLWMWLRGSRLRTVCCKTVLNNLLQLPVVWSGHRTAANCLWVRKRRREPVSSLPKTNKQTKKINQRTVSTPVFCVNLRLTAEVNLQSSFWTAWSCSFCVNWGVVKGALSVCVPGLSWRAPDWI